jgi:hypothetical protein
MIYNLCDRRTEIVPQLFSPRCNPESSQETGNVTSRPGHKWICRSHALLLFCLFFGLSFRTFGQSQPTEYQIKAAFLFNFAKFVEWPPTVFPQANSPIVIGVLGKNVFGTDLKNTIRNRTVNNRPIQLEEYTSVAQATNCQILFISPSEKDNLANILGGLHSSILTVSETDEFIKAGGMINFIIQGDNVRFQISDDAAKKAGLKISSKLLTLAVSGH